MTGRYWFDNSLTNEGVRLGLLEKIADPRSIALLEELGLQSGWRCAELGAGGGSMARWMADRVGHQGSVVAVDRNVSQFRQLKEHPNVRIVECDLEDLNLEPATYDLVHTRNVLMHIATANEVIAGIVAALRPGGQLLFEEADYYGLGGITSPLFARVTAPLVAKWDWARSMPTTLSGLAVEDLRVTIDASMLHGGSDEAAFWAHTLMASEDRIVGASGSGSTGVTASELQEALALLADPTFWTPFASVVCVSATRI